jgi:glycosyltransferase involved in cell wall biosynthesis
MQETSFEYEIIIHDDASEDGTREILEEYASKYPALFKLILQDENQYSKGIDVMSVLFSHAKGKYIAMCEGDDYWTDAFKLQKQVEFLENNPNYTICYSQCQFYYENHKELGEVYPLLQDKDCTITLNRMVRGYTMPQTLTVLFRKSSLLETNFHKCEYNNDVILYYFLLKQGYGFCIDESMGVYRIHSQGVWSGKDLHRQFAWELERKVALCKTDESDDAVFFMLSQLSKPFSRRIIAKYPNIFCNAYSTLAKCCGRRVALAAFCKRLIFNENTDWVSSFIKR